MTQPIHHLATHVVDNQAPPLQDYDPWGADPALREAVAREGGTRFVDAISGLARDVGSADTLELGAQANRHHPVLRSFDRWGRRIDEVEFHPAYHELLRRAIAHRIAALPWQQPGPGAHVAHAAMAYLFYQAEAGVLCPVAMTYAVVPVLQSDPEVGGPWIAKVLTAEYDPRFAPAAEKRGVTIGMAMTEKQGGSDVRANSTVARPESGRAYRLTGHKWFCSAPMSDAFLTLAQAPGGLTCFLVPRVAPDGSRNRIFIQRLKDKLGNRSNASSEIEYDETFALRVGEEGRGVRTIIDMVHHTRLDAAVAPAGLMRQALSQALHHAEHRRAFGRRLVEQPLMRNVLADLALEVEAAVALGLRVARSFDEGPHDAQAAAFARLATAVTKYWLNKRVIGHVAEALECLGGAGFVEESSLPRMYREAPLNGIWEGSGNVICLDVLRGMRRDPATLAALMAEIEDVAASEPRVARLRDEIVALVRGGEELEGNARRLTERLAIALQACVLCRHAPTPIADAFLVARVDEGAGRAYGTLPPGVDLDRLIERARPVA